MYSHAPFYRDEIISMGEYRYNPCQHYVRRVSVLWGSTWYYYLTNVLDPQVLSAQQICELYRRRWGWGATTVGIITIYADMILFLKFNPEFLTLLCGEVWEVWEVLRCTKRFISSAVSQFLLILPTPLNFSVVRNPG